MEILKFKRLFIQILFFTDDDTCTDVYCIVFNDQWRI